MTKVHIHHPAWNVLKQVKYHSSTLETHSRLVRTSPRFTFWVCLMGIVVSALASRHRKLFVHTGPPSFGVGIHHALDTDLTRPRPDALPEVFLSRPSTDSTWDHPAERTHRWSKEGHICTENWVIIFYCTTRQVATRKEYLQCWNGLMVFWFEGFDNLFIICVIQEFSRGL